MIKGEMEMERGGGVWGMKVNCGNGASGWGSFGVLCGTMGEADGGKQELMRQAFGAPQSRWIHHRLVTIGLAVVVAPAVELAAVLALPVVLLDVNPVAITPS